MTQTQATKSAEEIFGPDPLVGIATEIRRDQHIDLLGNANEKGKYYYYISSVNGGADVKTPWIGIDKTGNVLKQEAFERYDDLVRYLGGDPAIKPVTNGSSAPTPAPQEQTLFDENDPMAVMQAARTTTPAPEPKKDSLLDIWTRRCTRVSGLGLTWDESQQSYVGPAGANVAMVDIKTLDDEAFEETLAKIRLFFAVKEERRPLPASVPLDTIPGFDGGSATSESTADSEETDPYAHLSEDELRVQVMSARDLFFPAYREAARLEAELKAKQQKFDEENATLIAEKKAACLYRDTTTNTLKAFAKSYATRTGDKSFDQYINFRDLTVIDYDEAEVMGWCSKRFPEAITEPSPVLDVKRFEAYVKECQKSGRELPPTVVIRKETEVTISKKIPLDGGAA